MKYKDNDGLLTLKETKEVLENIEFMFFGMNKLYQATSAHQKPEENLIDYELMIQKSEMENESLRATEKKLKNELTILKKTLNEKMKEKEIYEEKMVNSMQVRKKIISL